LLRLFRHHVTLNGSSHRQKLRSKLVLRGTPGNGQFSNPQKLKEKGGFYGRGDEDSVEYHIFESSHSSYVSTTESESVAARWAIVYGYGYVHLLQKPAIYINVPQSYKGIPPAPMDQQTANNVASEYEFMAVGNIPWKDVVVSRQTIGAPLVPLIPSSIYIGAPIVNNDYQVRNYSCQLLSGNEYEAELMARVLVNRKLSPFPRDNRHLSLPEAQYICNALGELSIEYKLNPESPYLDINSVNANQSFNKEAVAVCDRYIQLMVETGTEKKTHVSYAEAHTVLFKQSKHEQQSKVEEEKKMNLDESQQQMKKS